MKKKIILVVLLVILIPTITQLFTLMASNKTEKQPYTVVKKEKDFEIRFYPAATLATVMTTASSYKDVASPGFRKLAGYIFGGNQGNQKIAMTAPVVMNMGDSATMYFVMPKQYQKEQLPTPNSPNVRIVEEAPKTLAVIKYGGFSSDKEIKRYCKKLEETLTQNHIQWKGGFMYMGYNAPWDVVNRRNEVAVEVQ